MAKSHAKNRIPGLRALAGSGDGFWELNLVDGSAWFSDWIRDQLGWPAAQDRLNWAALRPAIGAEHWNAVLSGMRSHFEEREPFAVEIPIRIASGDFRWWRFQGNTERDEGGQPRYFSGLARDVTAERSSRMAMNQDLTWLRRGFDALPIPAALIDSAGAIVYLNRRWRELGGENVLLGHEIDVGNDYLLTLSRAAALTTVDSTIGGSAASKPAQMPDGARVGAALQSLLRGERDELIIPYQINTCGVLRNMRLHARPFEIDGARQLAVVHLDA